MKVMKDVTWYIWGLGIRFGKWYYGQPYFIEVRIGPLILEVVAGEKDRV